jgi:hypothetical protein
MNYTVGISLRISAVPMTNEELGELEMRKSSKRAGSFSGIPTVYGWDWSVSRVGRESDRV